MNTLDNDLENILLKTRSLWERVQNKTIFVSGGTGFFGVWLQMSFIYANKSLGLNSKMIVLTRNKYKFCKSHPQLLDNSVHFLEGDINSFTFPNEEIHFIIHAATEASVKLNIESPLQMFDTIVGGTRRILEMAVDKSVESFLFTSSGAIYGAQPSDLTHISENYIGAPPSNDAASVYGEGKRMAEVLCAVYHKQENVPVKICRCFAFVGPFLPLDSHFAIGNFIGNTVNGNDIIIKGDGTPIRSYLYASDLTIWLWTILLQGKDNYPYNVGSDHGISIEQIASKVNNFNIARNTQVIVESPKSGMPTLKYVPDISRAKSELNLEVSVSLDEAITKTINFNIA